jgi:hypothetical protein
VHSASETLSRLAITPSTITPSTPITAFVRCLRSRSSLLRIRSSYAAVREHISSHCSLALQLKNVKGYPVGLPLYHPTFFEVPGRIRRSFSRDNIAPTLLLALILPRQDSLSKGMTT